VTGPRRAMHIQIALFPRSVYLAKSIPLQLNMILKIMHNLGHEIMARDEVPFEEIRTRVSRFQQVLWGQQKIKGGTDFRSILADQRLEVD